MFKFICFVSAATVAFVAALHVTADLAASHPNSRFAYGTQKAYFASAHLFDRAGHKIATHNPCSFGYRVAAASYDYLFADASIRTACQPSDRAHSYPVAHAKSPGYATPSLDGMKTRIGRIVPTPVVLEGELTSTNLDANDECEEPAKPQSSVISERVGTYPETMPDDSDAKKDDATDTTAIPDFWMEIFRQAMDLNGKNEESEATKQEEPPVCPDNSNYHQYHPECTHGGVCPYSGKSAYDPEPQEETAKEPEKPKSDSCPYPYGASPSSNPESSPGHCPYPYGASPSSSPEACPGHCPYPYGASPSTSPEVCPYGPCESAAVKKKAGSSEEAEPVAPPKHSKKKAKCKNGKKCPSKSDVDTMEFRPSDDAKKGEFQQAPL